MGAPFSIAHYRVTAKIGQGGMGEVWRATDTKLGRDVALKILPEAFAQDADRMARFTREAQVLASLNHSNIASIYGVEERALVMELVEGPTLAGRIAQGPVPIEEALPIAKQIAEALEYAHEKGVVHRDLKPANIKITPEGRVKILDFGLAKALSNELPAADSLSSPTLTMRDTLAGTILGTAAYMSPEQAKGKPVDRRADIWAFGIVLAEILTGRQMYTGETVSETLAAVIMKEPDLGSLPADTPPSIRALLQRCLDRDPQFRLRDAGEARVTLHKYLANPNGDRPARGAGLPSMSGASPVWRWAVGVLVISVLALGGLLWRGARPEDRPPMRFSTDLGPDAVAGAYLTVAISPDGRRIVFPVRGTRLATRLMDESQITVLSGTEGGDQPFFSPDGEWIGFFADGKMKKVSVRGGAAVTICDAPSARGASWGEDGNIIANIDLVHLFRVPSAGGPPQIIAGPEDKEGKRRAFPGSGGVLGQMTYRHPQVLPGSQAVLLTAGAVGNFDDASIGVLSLGTGELKIVQRGGYFGRYLPSGHLIYVHQDTLFAVAFDLKRMETRGTPLPWPDRIACNPGPGTAQLDVAGAASGQGTVVYLAGSGARTQQLVWLNAEGKAVAAPVANAITPRFSPDGKLLALSRNRDISIFDPVLGTMTQLTFTARSNTNPVWTPDGKHIVYASTGGIWWTRADGSGQPERLLNATAIPNSFSRDGKELAFTQSDPNTGQDIWVLPLDTSDAEHPKPGQPKTVVQTPQNDLEPAFSPDSRWLAYTSTEAGALHVYVRSTTAASGKWLISPNSTGRFPVWSRTRSELFFETADGHIMVADYSVKGEVFSALQPRQWCETPIQVTGPYQNLDLAADGKRFMVVFSPVDHAAAEKTTVHAVFLVNFADELKRRIR